MKKLLMLPVILGITFSIYARDFQPTWIEQMSDYIGKNIDDIPYSFTAVDNGYVYADRSKAGGFLGIGSRNVFKIIFANNRKIVEYAFWYMDSWLAPDETRELSDIEGILRSQYGTPNGDGVWIWTKSGGFIGIGRKVYEIGIYRDSSDGSACVLIQEQKSGFEKRWVQLLNSLGIK
jgi:hypothetical protein